MNETREGPGWRDLADSGSGLACAVLYVLGIGLVVVGSAAAFVWAPLLWIAAVGFVVITVSFAISSGRF